MSPPWTPPRRSYHLRIFALSLGLVVLGLAGFLFGVRMEALEPAKGTIGARDLTEVRSLLAGLIEPGWYEGEVVEPGGRVVSVRLDTQGDGVGTIRREPGGTPTGELQFVARHRLDGRLPVAHDKLRFHRLQAGDELWPGQPIAAIRCEAERLRLRQIEDRLLEWQSSGNHEADRHTARAEAESLRQRLSQATLRVPESEDLWQAVQVRVAPLQAVQPGDLVATIVPVDAVTRQPLDLVARLEVDERHAGSLVPGQTVRLVSALHEHHLHGRAVARIERIEPWAEATAEGGRRYVVIASIVEAPFALPLGSSVTAEIVVGRKLVYRIILEH
jgi:hypothetical protein